MKNKILEEIAQVQKELLNHELYKRIKTPEDLSIFMEFHVYAVWDFMSLLKALQNNLTCTNVPWVPVGDAKTRYLINEIVLAEETDVNIYGEHQSHFEMYLSAMEKAGASTVEIKEFIQTDFNNHCIQDRISRLPHPVQEFLKFTFDVIASNKLHLIASVFTFGRENLIPSMFTAIIENIQKNFPESDLTEFKYYFNRHIDLDKDEHGPMAIEMVEQLCGNDQEKWKEARDIAIKAIKKRTILWNGILNAVPCDLMA